MTTDHVPAKKRDEKRVYFLPKNDIFPTVHPLSISQNLRNNHFKSLSFRLLNYTPRLSIEVKQDQPLLSLNSWSLNLVPAQFWTSRYDIYVIWPNVTFLWSLIILIVNCIVKSVSNFKTFPSLNLLPVPRLIKNIPTFLQESISKTWFYPKIEAFCPKNNL